MMRKAILMCGALALMSSAGLFAIIPEGNPLGLTVDPQTVLSKDDWRVWCGLEKLLKDLEYFPLGKRAAFVEQIKNFVEQIKNSVIRNPWLAVRVKMFIELVDKNVSLTQIDRALAMWEFYSLFESSNFEGGVSDPNALAPYYSEPACPKFVDVLSM